jgi:uncharacterized protein YggE
MSSVSRRLSVCFVFFLFSALPVHADIERRITVSGACLKRVTPDRGAITLTAEAQDPDLREASRQATRVHERLRDEVKKLGLKDAELQTSEYQVQEVREWAQNKSVSRGFRARMGLHVSTSEIARVGEVIAIGARQQVRDVGALQVFLSTERMRQERFACLEEAARDARRKAERLAQSLDSKLGKVETLTEIDHGGFEPPMPLMMTEMRAKGAAADMPPPSVEAGSREIRVSVNATFSLQ